MNIIIIIIIIIFSDNKIICMSNKMEHNTHKIYKNGFIVKTTTQNLHVVWYPVL